MAPSVSLPEGGSSLLKKPVQRGGRASVPRSQSRKPNGSPIFQEK